MGRDVDLEWVYDGKRLHWVQLRTLTGTTGLDRYTNTFSQEFLPGMIKPLVWSVNVPINARAWVRLLGELTGRRDLHPERLAKSFYHRAYFNMGEFGKVWEAMGLPEDMLESMVLMQGGGMRMRPSPKLALGIARTLPFLWAKRRWFSEVEGAMVRLQDDYKTRSSEDLSDLSDEELLRRVDDMMVAAEEAAYYTVLCMIASSIATGIWKRFLGRKGLDWQRMSLLMEGEGGFPEGRIRELGSMYRKAFSENVGSSDLSREFQEAFDRFLADFGHYSESGNDMSVPPWRERPELVMEAIRNTDGMGRKEAIKARGPLAGGLQRQEAKLRSYRERMGSTYTKHYSMFRRYFLEVGNRLATRGVIPNREQVFMLNLDELRTAMRPPWKDLRNLVLKREGEMHDLADMQLPSVIFGDTPPPVHKMTPNELKGIPSSGGYHRGRARIIKSLEDVGKLGKGDIMVIPYSDVGWTPFFHLAGAVVSESGGMLSHSSIIAREYGIPAVVSVAGAMRLRDGVLLDVDGFMGKVSVVEGSGL